MKRVTLALLGASILGLLLASQVATGEGDTPLVMVNDQGVWYRADLQVTRDVFGQTLKPSKGSLVDVSLAENPTTGYTWRLTCEPKGNATLVRSAFVPPTSGLIGAGGTRHFLLLVNEPGTTVVTLQYGQWWDGGTRQDPRSFTIEATTAKLFG